MWEISSFYTCVPKITIIWCTAPEIQSETHNFCHFGPLYIFCTFFVLSTEFFIILDHSLFAICLLFYSTTTLKIKILKINERKKKKLEILSFYKCLSYMTMMWCMFQNSEFFVILDHFLSFFTHSNPKDQNFEKIKKKENEKKRKSRSYNFINVYPKWKSYEVCFLIYGARRAEFVVILDRFLAFYHPNNPKNQNFEKIKQIKCPEKSF